MDDGRYKNYLGDLGRLIREKALEAKAEKDAKGADYELGRLMAYHEVVSLMQAQASVFEIPLEDLGLAELNPEVDLL